MTGAMYAAIGGLRSHMSKLNVIGNNIANVNTFGYKSQRMTFKESIYGTTRSGSNGGVTAGGNNPSQIGYGCSVGTIDLNMSPSTYSPTGVDLDCYIDGDGFFLVGDKLTKEETFDDQGNVTGVNWSGGVTSGEQLKDYDMTRVGDFWVDPDGYVCNGDGKIVYGFARVQNPNYVDGASKAQINAMKQKGIDIESETIISTHLVPLRVPLQAAAPTVANGGKVVVNEDGEIVNKKPDANGNITLDAGESLVNVWEEGDPVYPFLNNSNLNQYAEPNLTQIGKGDPGDGAAGTTPTVPGKNTTTIPVAENTASDRVSNVMPVQLRNMSIGKDGSIVGTANGKNVVLGYIAIATTDNPNGVTHTGGPYYKCMPGAGNMRISTLGLDLPTNYLGNKLPPDATDAELTAAGATRAAAIDRIPVETATQLQSQGLEASGTDLAFEFAEMVTAQRGYQANTRIVSVTDSMLEELVNMKR